MSEYVYSRRGIVKLVATRVRWAVLAAGVLASVATTGYVAIEHYSWLDAVYMTVITLGTIGFGEVRPLHSSGRIFTIGIVISSFATLVYFASVLTNLFASGEVTQYLRDRRLSRMCADLDQHVIVVGFGRVGQAVVASLKDAGTQCVVMDTNPDHAEVIAIAGAIQVIGDATDETALIEAGIERAAALIAAADQDSENLVVVLTARSMRADLRIVSRVNRESWVPRMRRAGADVAESPYPSYGQTLAAAAVTDS